MVFPSQTGITSPALASQAAPHTSALPVLGLLLLGNPPFPGLGCCISLALMLTPASHELQTGFSRGQLDNSILPRLCRCNCVGNTTLPSESSLPAGLPLLLHEMTVLVPRGNECRYFWFLFLYCPVELIFKTYLYISETLLNFIRPPIH